MSPTITIELFGIPRARAGRAEVVVSAATVGEALHALIKTCPALMGLCQAEGQLAPQYLLSLNGEGFLTDLSRSLGINDRLLVLSADAGG